MAGKRERRVGSARGKRQYDLPLNKSVGAGFLILLIALMTFLAVMALAGSFVLGSMTERWSSGLENKMTLEIPAENSNGTIRTRSEIEALETKIETSLNENPDVATFEILQEQQVRDLISPWLGDDAVLKDIPLPGLVSVDLNSDAAEVLGKLERDMAAIGTDIRLDTHESWLGSLLRLTGALQFAALLISLIIGATTVTAVAGAIRARMAVHKEDVQLLHLIGANDTYIMRQFQRHALIMAVQGSLLGAAAGIIVLLTVGFISGDTAAELLPDFDLNFTHVLALVAVPLLACLISAVAARFTVLRELRLMP